MMKTNNSIFLCIILCTALAMLTGCRSPSRNPAGVSGSEFEFDTNYETAGAIPMGNRFIGGNEYPGMFESVLFSFDSSQVPADQRSKIEAVANHLKQNPSNAVIIEGHCDERGSLEYNLALGEQRAQAVRAYLSGLGIGADRIQTKSYGEERPVSLGHDSASWNMNRRGEFVLYY